jgi:hypothetical protein
VIQRLDLRWLGFPVLEKLVHRNLKGLRVIRVHIEQWDRVAVLDARGVAAEVLGFPDCQALFGLSVQI